MKARDLMTANPHVITGDEPASRAARLMRDFNVGIIPVVDDRAHLHPRGVITDRDIAVRCLAEPQSASRRVEHVMTRGPLAFVTADAGVSKVIAAMERGQVRRILVVENGRLVGIISQADLALKQGPVAPLQVERVIETLSAPALVGGWSNGA